MKTNFKNLYNDFLESEQTSGIILIACTIGSILVANSWFGKAYSDFWHTSIGFDIGHFSLNYSVEHWINDGLMAVFFLLIGLEIERELYVGELSRPKQAILPVIAAIGGMVTPALLHFLFNRETVTQGGAGIPMATDIAFALGVLALLGNKVPLVLKVFLTALAIIDDLGAIVVIALCYVGNFSLPFLLLALGVFTGLLVMNRLGVYHLWAYLIPGVLMWYFLLRSGVHATLAGVLLAFAIPFRRGDEASPSYRLQHVLHKPVAFIVMPIFALANTGVVFGADWAESLLSVNSMGIIAGLCVGKPLGIVLFCLIAVKLGLSRLPAGVGWKHLVGTGFLGGIGFTMSIFITLLAFGDPLVVQNSKIAILIGSALAGITGFVVLRRQLTKDIPITIR